VTVYEVGPGGAVGTTWSLVPSSRGGDVGVELPEGWTGGAAADQFGFGSGIGVVEDMAFDAMGNPIDPSGAGDIRLRTDGATSNLTQAVGPGGFALLEARGPVPELAGALEVTAQSPADGEITGTVRNNLDVALHEVAAFTGRATAIEVGTLEPGESKEFRIEDATRFAWSDPPELDVWPADAGGFAPWGGDAMIVPPDAGAVIRVEARRAEAGVAVLAPGRVPPAGGGGSGDEPDDDGDADDDGDGRASVVLSAWNETLRRTGGNYRPIGQVVVAGWTDRLGSPAIPTRGRVERTTTAVVARATATPAADRLTDTASVKSVVRGPATQLPPNTPEAQAAAAIGFIQALDLPDRVGNRPVDVNRLAINLSELPLTAAFWTPRGWVDIEPVAVGQEERLVPPEAVVGGTVYMLGSAATNATPGPGRDLAIYERAAP
jgi:hypothetical protein